MNMGEGSTFRSVLSDLRRRRVFKVAAIYAAAAWLVVQVAGEVVPALFLPPWVLTAIVVLAIAGFLAAQAPFALHGSFDAHR